MRIVLALLAATTILIGLVNNVSAAEVGVTSDCNQVEVVFARGSGQDLRGREYAELDSQLSKYFNNTNIDYGIYELGTAHQRGSDGIGYKYRAIGVGWQHPVNSAGAKIGAGLQHDYGKSVEEGVKELALYLNQRFTRGNCTSSRIILAGYSQG